MGPTPSCPTRPWSSGAKEKSKHYHIPLWVPPHHVPPHHDQVEQRNQPINHYHIPLWVPPHPDQVEQRNQPAITTYPCGSHPTITRWSKKPTNHYSIPSEPLLPLHTLPGHAWTCGWPPALYALLSPVDIVMNSFTQVVIHQGRCKNLLFYVAKRNRFRWPC